MSFFIVAVSSPFFCCQDTLYYDLDLPWMYPGINYTGTFTASGQKHYYKFYVSKTGGVKITLSFASGRDFDLELYSARTGSQLSYSWYYNPEIINYTITSPGWYVVMVAAYSGTGNYTLTLTSTGATIR